MLHFVFLEIIIDNHIQHPLKNCLYFMDYQKNKYLCMFLHKSDYSLLLLNIITLFF